MGIQYSHLSLEGRVLLQLKPSNGASIRCVAARLYRSPSTLSRELRRLEEPAYAATLPKRISLAAPEHFTSAPC